MSMRFAWFVTTLVLAGFGCAGWEDPGMTARGGASSASGGATSGGSSAFGGTSGDVGSGGSKSNCSLPRFVTKPVLRGLHVVGSELQDADGNVVRLRGVNRAGSEYACIEGKGFFDGPTDDTAIAAMLTWNVNAVRIPLNEACWLSINIANPRFTGDAYKSAIKTLVSRLEEFGLVPILELHRAAPGALAADRLYPMPNADHTPDFWRDVATTFVADDAVVFEPYNEPFPDNNRNSELAWSCWRDGCKHPQIRWGDEVLFPEYEAVGMQELVSTIRDAGAPSLILLGGIQYSNRVSRWLEFAPSDPLGNLGAAWHIYNFNSCSNSTCWNSEAAKVAAEVPLVATEIGQDDCQSGMVNPLMQFLDEQRASYLAWWWYVSPGNCVPATNSNHGDGVTLSLIDSYTCPTPKGAFGRAIYDHFTQNAP
jgi:hypothetical protein